MSKPNEKAEESAKPPKAKKPPGFRKFEKLLRQVVKPPPLRQREEATER
jgi:hypothetical protein